MSRIVGTDVPRPEGPAKVAGRALYVADLDVPGAWVGGAVRADVARGRLLGVDRDPAFDFARVVVVGPEDVPGENVQALIVDDQPVLAAKEVRHWGEPLLLVAAPDRATLVEALRALRPRIEPLEAVLDFERSTRVFKEIDIDKGDVDGTFAAPPAGARVFEGEYRTDSQEQLYIEPQGCIAWPPERDGTITVKGSLQCPHYVRKALARCMGVALEQARVVQCETGGGFGGKEEYPSVVACHAALLAKKCGKAVKVLYERHEDLLVTPKRHPSRVVHRTLVGEDGTLLAMDVDVLFDGGAYTTLSPVVLSRGCIHAAGPYRCANVRIRGRVVATNHVPYGAFRGFGAPQTCFAVERMLDRIARGIGMHPAELRWKNRLRLGDATATGQVLKESVGATEVLERVFERTEFDRREWCGLAVKDSAAIRSQAPFSPIPEGQRQAESNGGNRGKRSQAPSRGGAVTSEPLRGRGLSFFFHGAGFTGSGEEMLKGRVRVSLLPDGRVEVLAGSTEIGQGTNALFAAIASEALGSALDDVVVATPDTARVPDSGPTVASRTCMVVGGCLANACRELRARVDGAEADANAPTRSRANTSPDSGSSLRERARAFLARGGDGVVTTTYHSPAGLQWDDARYRGDAYPVYGWAADLAEVEVDPLTFDVRVTRISTAVDVGKALQPKLVEGQIEGGTLQAIGWSQLEVITTRAGRFEQDRLATCIIPTTLDAPPVDVMLVEIPFAHGPFGAKGVGEMPMDGGAPAVIAAIEDALGLHLTHLPATPERILEAWLAAHPEERA
ncbi:MAG: xanthine dehydrogenase family protein [Planctomycetes bacterium]|nr:xanthine dehydrogenase family protein [Planctomycetota bacterium]